MTRTVQDVKFALHSIMDKLMGNNQEPFSKEEIEILVFAFESNILFDNVAHKFLPSLKGLPDIEEGITATDIKVNIEHVEEPEHNSQDGLITERSNMVKAILHAVFKENIFHDLRIRFGA